MREINRRRSLSVERLFQLRRELTDADELLAQKACVYVSGSFGRHEASEHSDLDLFIVGKGDKKASDRKPLLRNIDEVIVKASLIQAARKLDFPDFDRDGEFIKQHLIDDLVGTIGTPDDDKENTFTARLLLLLESKPLCEESIYQHFVDCVIKSYWRDFEGHESSFIPAFLVNDILRLWRTFCVNYESASSKAQVSKTSKRKLKNYKLKHSRILTCFSSILFCQMIVSNKNTMTPDDAREMIKLSPLERLEICAADSKNVELISVLNKCLERYNDFLEITSAKPDAIYALLENAENSAKLFGEANTFGDLIADAIRLAGSNERLRRIITV